ncbi:MAG: WbqC family protein, partial [Bacteroidales bacterium]|nr:WbqC family protein [Bacteroidales bacterium]
MLLSTAYFPPVQYVALLCQKGSAQIEMWEHYVKQSYRNRTTILSANGKLDLIMPLEKAQGSKTLIKDVKIAYHDRWNAEHWNAISSAYNSSPFFEYYKEDLERFFTKKYTFLIDYNQEILQCILQLLHIQCDIQFTQDFVKPNDTDDDFRYTLSPKVAFTATFPSYTQVFEDKFPFIPNLSILDLLCNEGPESKEYLK